MLGTLLIRIVQVETTHRWSEEWFLDESHNEADCMVTDGTTQWLTAKGFFSGFRDLFDYKNELGNRSPPGPSPIKCAANADDKAPKLPDQSIVVAEKRRAFL